MNRRHVKTLIKEFLSECQVEVYLDAENDISVEITFEGETLIGSNYCSLRELENE